MTKGNEFELSVDITINEAPLNIDEVDMIEFTVNDCIRKIYPGPFVYYNDNTGKFLIYLTQEDTFSLNYNFLIQARVKFNTGLVFASSIEKATLWECLSKEII